MLAVAFAGIFSVATVSLATTTEVMTQSTFGFRGNFTDPAREIYYILRDYLSPSHGFNDVSAPVWTTTEFYVLPFSTQGSEKPQEYEGPTLGVGVDTKCDLVEADRITVECNDKVTGDAGRCWAHNCSSAMEYVTVDYPCWAPETVDSGQRIAWVHPTFDSIIPSFQCADTFFAIWVDGPVVRHPQYGSIQFKNNVTTVMLHCKLVEKVVQLTATVHDDRQVLSTTTTNQLDDHEVITLYSGNTSSTTPLASSFMEIILAGFDFSSHDGGHEIRWFDYFMVTLEPSIVQNTSNITHIPDTSHLIEVSEDVYKRLFAINLGLYANEIISVEKPYIVPGGAVFRRDRVYMRTVMVYIALAILEYLIVLLLMYRRQERHVVHRLPINLVGMFSLLYASSAEDECGEAFGTNSKQRLKSLVGLGQRYSYGRPSERSHVGVYREE